MDWQHLIMNGENLAEYAALLAAEGLLGHQHANSGWGTFDDDNMVGATAFMETLELALELRRVRLRRATASGSASTSTPTPRTRSGRCKRSVLQWRFIDSVAAKIDEAALREAQQRKDAVRGLRARVRRARRVTRPSLVGIDVGTTARQGRSRSRRTARVLASAEAGYPLSTPRPGWAEQDPERLVAAADGGARAAARGRRRARRDRPLGADARARRARRGRPRAAAGDPLERPADGAPSAPRSSARSGSSG